MSNLPDVLCLSANPKLKGFDRPLLQALSQKFTIAQWEYCQTQDEPSSLAVALELLHDYLQQLVSPIHLVGHGISGLLGLLYAQHHPERVRSLTLLSVGIYPAQDWQYHYYTHRQSLPCSRQVILTQMVHDLFGFQSKAMIQKLVKLLEQDLDHSLSPHSLFRRMDLLPIRPTVPLLTCGSVDDIVVNPHHLRSWQQYFHEDKATLNWLWVCSGGRYFFHYFYPQQTALAMFDFWASLPPIKQPLSEELNVSVFSGDSKQCSSYL
ncbi:MAG: alpha/beta hydrolase [Chroococcidiopsidaceae cyanobacterium CP_BM_ER_R8_30]|nr:alpha/beta hydrolase [Chroococcidiopsidaceae cyanobacterium CP_BM_ER_R8_30]